VKSILIHNNSTTTDESEITDVILPVESNTFELRHPKDDLELKKEKLALMMSATAAHERVVEVVEQVVAQVQEAIPPAGAATTKKQHGNSSSSSGNNGPSEDQQGTTAISGGGKMKKPDLRRLIQTSDLSSDEVTGLVEILLNRDNNTNSGKGGSGQEWEKVSFFFGLYVGL
jgi:hypothetical protein